MITFMQMFDYHHLLWITSSSHWNKPSWYSVSSNLTSYYVPEDRRITDNNSI